MLLAIVLIMMMVMPPIAFADYFWAITTDTAKTTSGTQTISTSKLGGLTPKGAILMISEASTINTTAGGARGSIGFASPGSQRMIIFSSEDNQSATDNDSAQVDNNILSIPTYDRGYACVATLSSFTTNGIIIDWSTNNCSTAYIIIAIFVAGSDTSAKAGTFTMPTSASTLDVTDVGFLADSVFAFKSHANAFGTASWAGSLAFNWTHADNQSTDITDSIGVFWRNNQNPATDVNIYISNGSSFECSFNCGSEAEFTIDSYDSSGFDLDVTDTSGAEPYGYFAFKGDLAHWTGLIQTPSGADAGATSYSLGFEPGFTICMMTSENSSGSAQQGSDSGTFGFFVTDYTDTYSITWAQEYNTPGGTTDSFSRVSDDVYTLDSTGAQLYDGTISATSSAFEIDFTDNPAQQNYWLCSAVQAQPAGAGGSKFINPGGYMR